MEGIQFPPGCTSQAQPVQIQILSRDLISTGSGCRWSVQHLWILDQLASVSDRATPFKYLDAFPVFLLLHLLRTRIAGTRTGIAGEFRHGRALNDLLGIDSAWYDLLGCGWAFDGLLTGGSCGL